MKMEYLQQTACQLREPAKAAAMEFESNRETLAEELNRRMSARPDLEKLIGPGNLSMMQDNSRNFCRFMSAMFQGYEPDVLVQTALWVFRAYRGHGFETIYWPANLDTFVGIMRERVTPNTFQEVYPFFHWLIVNIPSFVNISDAQMALIPPPTDHPLPNSEGKS